MDYGSALERDELSVREETHGIFKCILFSERSQLDTAIYYVIPMVYDTLGKAKPRGQENGH